MPRPRARNVLGRSSPPFEEALEVLRSEYVRVKYLADSVTAENQALRQRLAAGAGVVDVAQREPQPASVSAWRHEVEVAGSAEAKKVAADGQQQQQQQQQQQRPPPTSPPPVALLQQGGYTLAVVPPPEDEFKGANSQNEAMEGVDSGEEWTVVASEDRRLDVCLGKLREFLELANSKHTVTLERIEDYLRRVGRPSEEVLESFATVFDRLVEREKTSAPAGTASSHMRAIFASIQSGSNLAVEVPGPGSAGGQVPKRSGTKSINAQVQLKTLAQLLLADDVQDILGPCSDKILEVVKLLRLCTFHQDTMGILPSLRAVNDLEQECKHLVFESRLDIVMNCVIAANAISMGIFATTETAPTQWGGAQISNMVFTLIFMLEAFIKLYRQGRRRYFCGHDCPWNIFDLCIVALGIVDFTATLAIASTKSFNTSSLMVLKLLRLGRLLRVLRMSVFRELKLMINGILGLFKTLGCAMIILLFGAYLIGTLMVQFFAGRLGDEVVHQEATLFSTVPRSMFTVFRCLNLGDCNAADGSPIALHLGEEFGWPYALIHCLLSILMQYGLGSLMTALVVETTLNEAKKAEFRATLKESHKKQVSWSLHRLEQIFQEEQKKQVSENFHQEQLPTMLFIGRKTFDTVVQMAEVQSIFDLLDIDAADRVVLFDALDSDSNGYVEVNEVVTGLLSMAGKARRADIVATRLKVDALVKRFQATHAEVVDRQGAILERLDTLLPPTYRNTALSSHRTTRVSLAGTATATATGESVPADLDGFRPEAVDTSAGV